jgi:carbonic anhydrase
MRLIKTTLITLTSILILQSPIHADVAPSKALTQEKQQKLSPKDVLNSLKEGNQRFLSDKRRTFNYGKEMKVTSKKGQFPKAVIFNCIDSRSIAEILFDQGLGSIFVSRIAGNVSSPDVVGGMEFATKFAGSSLIVVMGHTLCGAVQGACMGGGEGDLGHLLAKIKPAVEMTQKESDKPLNCSNYEVVDKIAKQNVINQVKAVKESPIVKSLIEKKQIEVVGAMHDIGTGEVHFFDVTGQDI